MTQPDWYGTLTGRTDTDTITTGAASNGAPVTINDPHAYVTAAIERITRDLAEAPEGTRNPALFQAAAAMGNLIGAGLPLTENTARQHLEAACTTNRLIADDGVRSVQLSINSGLTTGAAKPLAWTQGSTTTIPPATPFIAPDSTPGVPADQRERTSWWPRNVDGYADQEEEPLPALLYRTDGVALAYAGKINGLIGESESGKTWVALEAVRQVLAEPDGVVGMLDFEDSYAGIKSRLTGMGVERSALNRFYYCSPAESLTQEARDDLAEFLTGHNPALVVVDGVNAAMTTLGLLLADNTDVTRFTRELTRPLTATGAGVITVDHVTKNREGRGAYAIGAQAKRADVNGCSLMVDVVAPFGRGMTGRLKITVAKDRPGHVRAAAVEAKHAAEAVITSTADGDVTVRLYALGIDDVDPIAEVMEVLSRFIEITPEGECPTTIEELAKSVGRRKDIVTKATKRLVDNVYLERDGKVWRHVRAYRRHGPEQAAPIGPGTVPNGPGTFGEGRAESVPRSPSLSGTGTDGAAERRDGI